MLVRAATLVALLGVAGCYAKVSNTSQGAPADASPAQPGVDAAAGDAPSDASTTTTPDAPTPTTHRVLYLNFDGATLTSAAATDATTGHARWLSSMNGVATGTTITIPPYGGDRTTVVNTVDQILTGLPVTVVTTRPASGPYAMIVLGGHPGLVHTSYLAETDHDCGDLVKNDIGWVEETNNSGNPLSAQVAANYVVGAVGWALGLDGAQGQNDCLCSWESPCSQSAPPCALLSASVPEPNTGYSCNQGATQDERATFQTAFGP